MGSYREILNIELLHEYYGNDQNNFLQLKPDVNTQDWFNQQGFKFIQTKNIGRLLVPETVDLQDLLLENPDFEIRFDCTSNTSSFINYTDFPLDQLGVLVFKNNINEESEKEKIELPQSFEEDANSGLVVALVVLSLKNIDNNKDNWPVNYVVPFKSRRTRWKYFIINSSLEQGTQLGLGGKGHDLFKDPESVELPNNTTAQLFDSDSNLIPIKEESSIDLKLKKVNSNIENTGEEVLMEHLPNASPDALQSLIVNGKQEIFSAIYVYI